MITVKKPNFYKDRMTEKQPEQSDINEKQKKMSEAELERLRLMLLVYGTGSGKTYSSLEIIISLASKK